MYQKLLPLPKISKMDKAINIFLNGCIHAPQTLSQTQISLHI